MADFSTFSYNRESLSRMPTRDENGNKGTFGRVLLVCGSRGMAGAAYLSALAALRTGAGLVEILTPDVNLPIIQTLLPEAVVSTYNEKEPSAIEIEKAVKRADVIVCGCGLGVSRISLFVLSRVLHMSNVPTVLDADALNLLARNHSLMKYCKGKIITPHPAELSRLTGASVENIVAEPDKAAHDFASKHGLVCVLKGHNTRVSDGSESIYVNNSGNTALSTGGSGDVLAGIIGAICSQSRNTDMTPFEAACLGVYIHGLCGDVCAIKHGEYSTIASDIIAALPEILKKIK